MVMHQQFARPPVLHVYVEDVASGELSNGAEIASIGARVQNLGRRNFGRESTPPPQSIFSCNKN